MRKHEFIYIDAEREIIHRWIGELQVGDPLIGILQRVVDRMESRLIASLK